MKKRLSLLMVLMMVLSLVPMSAFATAGIVPGGVVSVEDNEKTVEKVTVRLTQAAYDSLKAGQSRLTLNGADFARNETSTDLDDVSQKMDYSNMHVVTFNANNANGVSITQNTTAAITPIMSDVATVTVPNVTVTSDDMDILLELYLLFDEADAGDVTLSVEEVGSTKLKVADPIKIAVVKEAKSTDLNLVVTDSAKKTWS